MGFLSMDPLIGFAERAEILLNILYKVKNHPLLVVTGMEADRTVFAYLCQGSVKG